MTAAVSLAAALGSSALAVTSPSETASSAVTTRPVHASSFALSAATRRVSVLDNARSGMMPHLISITES